MALTSLTPKDQICKIQTPSQDFESAVEPREACKCLRCKDLQQTNRYHSCKYQGRKGPRNTRDLAIPKVAHWMFMLREHIGSGRTTEY